jgi:hypothetical protein
MSFQPEAPARPRLELLEGQIEPGKVVTSPRSASLVPGDLARKAYVGWVPDEAKIICRQHLSQPYPNEVPFGLCACVAEKAELQTMLTHVAETLVHDV